ncbi:hypothetical protein [Agaribacterium haliotis]|uniref:hypothetical protein n=1 Tax=Agaribacterium haliotis TaxID=2013869 RepID=UPI0013040DCA|nr:hypothetical protein [Agaribacterium haliotis]
MYVLAIVCIITLSAVGLVFVGAMAHIQDIEKDKLLLPVADQGYDTKGRWRRF